MSITGSNNPFACEPVVFANANAIVSLGTITRDGNQFTFSVGFVWKINGVTYQNTAPVVLTIAEASTGFQRIDNALLNTSNTIELQQGLESETIALRPVAPDTNIILTSWNISGDAIGDTETPIVGTQFKQKNENQKFNPTLGGTTAVITIQPFGQNYYSVGGQVTGIVGFSKALITASPTAEVPYAGKDFYIENKTDHNVTLKNAFSPVDIPFNLGADLVVPTNGIVWLKYNPNTEKMDLFFKSWSEVDLSTKADLVGGKVPSSQLPSYVDDVLEFTDFDAFPTTGETGKIYIALDTNKTYRWSGSAYVQIGGSSKKTENLFFQDAMGSTVRTITADQKNMHQSRFLANASPFGQLGLTLGNGIHETSGVINLSYLSDVITPQITGDYVGKVKKIVFSYSRNVNESSANTNVMIRVMADTKYQTDIQLIAEHNLVSTTLLGTKEKKVEIPVLTHLPLSAFSNIGWCIRSNNATAQQFTRIKINVIVEEI